MRAFVAMPFNPSFLPVWRSIKEACKVNGIKPIRVDHLPQVDNIHQAIFNEIDASDLVFVDFSGDRYIDHPNANVVSEAMYAKTKQKPLVILSQSTDALPFDWRVHRAIIYNADDMDYLLEVLSESLEEIKERITSTMNMPVRTSSPSPTRESGPSLLGFQFLKEVAHSCGGQTHTVQEYVHEPTGLEFVLVPGGSYQMGDTRWSDSHMPGSVALLIVTGTRPVTGSATSVSVCPLRWKASDFALCYLPFSPLLL